MISITSGTISSIGGNGSNVVIKVGSGSITLNDVVNMPIHIKNANDTDSLVAFNGTSSVAVIYNDIDNVLANVSGTAYADCIYNAAEVSTINAASGNDIIYNGDYRNNVRHVSINAGDGNDTIYHYGKYSTINAGTGNDTIYGYGSTDTIQIAGSEYTTSTVGNDVLISVGSGSMLLKDAKNVKLNIVTIEGGGTTPTVPTPITDQVITNYNISSVVSGTAYSDTITNYGRYSTIYGNAGDDIIFNPSLASASGSSTNITDYIDGSDGNDSIENYSGTHTTVRGGNGNDTIQNFYSTAHIFGDADDDYIINTKASHVTIHGGTGNDTITNNRGMSHVHSIVNAFNFNTLSGGDGDDTLTNTSGSYVSLSGGSGNI